MSREHVVVPSPWEEINRKMMRDKDGKIIGIFAKADIKLAGQIRLDKPRNRLVYLTRYVFVEIEKKTVKLWHVRDVLTEARDRVDQVDLGRTFCHMEVLAWAAK